MLCVLPGVFDVRAKPFLCKSELTAMICRHSSVREKRFPAVVRRPVTLLQTRFDKFGGL